MTGSIYLVRLVAGPYDGDDGILSVLPGHLWAYRCQHTPACDGIDIHWGVGDDQVCGSVPAAEDYRYSHQDGAHVYVWTRLRRDEPHALREATSMSTDPGAAQEQKPPVSARVATAAGRARPCECDRPMVFRDEDLGLICGRCGHEPAGGTDDPVPRAPLALAAVAAGLEVAPPPPRAVAPPTAGTKYATVIALVAELGQATAADVAQHSELSQHRAGVLLGQLCRAGRLVRVGHRRSPRGGRPFTIVALPEVQGSARTESMAA